MPLRFIALAFLISALTVGCASTPNLSEADIAARFPDLQTLETALEQARSNNVDLLAPGAYQQAAERFQRAETLAVSGQPATADQASAGLGALEQARTQSTRAADVFDEVLAARDKAVRAGAPAHDRAGFDRIDDRLRRAAALLESGASSEAQRNNAQLRDEYAALELAALQANAVERAAEGINTARRANAEDLAPKTLALAEEELQIALDVLAADSTAVEKADIHARRSLFHSQRALNVSQIVQRFEDGRYSDEDKVLWYQEQLASVLAPLNDNLPFDTSNKDLVSSARAELDAMIAALSASQAEVSALAAEKDAIQTQALLDAEQERRRNQAIAAKFATIQALFAPEQAEVYRQGDNVLIRAHGFDFPSGTSEITSSNFPLLRQITAAIEQFPNSTVVVSGHTDSLGGDAANLRLSEDRASKVADFLVEVNGVARERIDSTGYGASQPVANNETAEGRAANRRVEILIRNQDQLL